MKRLLLSIVAALCAPGVASAVEIYGVWVRDGHPTDKLEFFDCQGKLCAKGVLPMLDGSPPPLVLRHAAKTGPNSWKGDLFNPEDGKTYTGKIAYEAPNQLTLTGCLVAFLCQSETWTRISGPPKPAAPAESKGDAKSEGKNDSKAAKAPAGDSAKAPDKGADKGAPAAKAAAGQDAKSAKPAKPADPKSAAPPKAAPAKPAPKPAAGE
ncbi:DUF2147 domain-containing protein [Methylocystis sp. S23]